MRAYDIEHSVRKLDRVRPGLSRVSSAAVVTAVVASLLFVAVPASALAVRDDEIDETVLVSLTLATASGEPKIDVSSAAARPLPSKPVLRTAVPKPSAKRASSAIRTASTAKKSSRSGATGGWSTARVSWYGPGFYGNTMAGGGTLERDSMVVAHRSLPFGTRVMFSYKGRTVTAVVKDRGPYSGGRLFDLGPGTASALGFSGVGTVKYRILGR